MRDFLLRHDFIESARYLFEEMGEPIGRQKCRRRQPAVRLRSAGSSVGAVHARSCERVGYVESGSAPCSGMLQASGMAIMALTNNVQGIGMALSSTIVAESPAASRFFAEVAEAIKCHQLDHIDWSVPPPLKSELLWAQTKLGELVFEIATSRKVGVHDRVEALRLLLDAGMSPDARFGGRLVNGVDVREDGSGRSSVLMLCVQHEFVGGVRLLIDRGADVLGATSDHGFTVLDQAVTCVDPDCLRSVLAAGRYDEFMALHKRPRDVPDFPFGLFRGVTSSIRKASRAAEVVTLLLENGMPRSGLLTGMVTHGSDCDWIVDLLVRHGCDAAEGGNAPAIAAATTNKPKMLCQLFERGVDPHLKGASGGTLAQYGSRHAQIKALVRAWRASRSITSSVGVRVEGVGDAALADPPVRPAPRGVVL